MSRAPIIRSAIVAIGLIIIAVVALRVLPIVTGPAIPPEAVRLDIRTATPNISLQCMAALLPPVRVSASGDDLVLVSVGTGDLESVVWPSGFAAWRVQGRAQVADPWGNIVAREGDVLDYLGGGQGLDGAFILCPFDLVSR